ncbi:DUF6516 family protein [Candidatus Regiella endosymbiont of Tuberolachnus salignus]|uniref:DUF6516 family protein n=1 Tax=Candidatus Regiella endosymbiont of Tuberolachnus salignus TaxID=3077956 RepID=UPI0030D10FF9
MDIDNGLDYLLSLHGTRVNRDDGYWWKIEAWMVKKTPFIPHGIRYSLTLHDKYNTRVFGIDNAHAIKLPKKGKYVGRVVYDHQHRTPSDKGYPYTFCSEFQLIEDFFTKIDEIINTRETRG